MKGDSFWSYDNDNIVFTLSFYCFPEVVKFLFSLRKKFRLDKEIKPFAWRLPPVNETVKKKK